METYIVRFYRRAARAAHEAVGTVEHVGSGKRAAFTGERELLDRLFEADECSGSAIHEPDASVSTPGKD
ncbi:MAG TPA: hypothetical protein VFR86_05250 [Burkholderiaceae bacterium]|nr:hypothetical protein [Burkholderiaceae bacterium]